jgi:hypothetical protein
MQKHNVQKNSPKETKILQDTITLQLISQVSTQAKISPFQNPQIKIDLLHRGQKSIKLLYSIMNLNTISLPTNKLALPRRRSLATEGKEHALRNHTTIHVRDEFMQVLSIIIIACQFVAIRVHKVDDY